MQRINDDDLYLADDGSYEYEDKPFTGVAVEYSRDGSIIGETEYLDGLQSGKSRYWYPSGELKGEKEFLRNGHHGWSREWYQNGQLKEETLFEHSIRLRERCFDPEGKVLSDFTLAEDAPLYQTLLQYREIYKDGRSD